MRWILIIVALGGALPGLGCGGVTAPLPATELRVDPPATPAVATLKVSIPSVAVSRFNNRWFYTPKVLVTETAGRAGAIIHSYYVNQDTPIVLQEDCDSSLMPFVPPGGTLDLTAALGFSYCWPGATSIEPLTSVTVTVRSLGPTGMIESSGSIDVP